MSENDITYTTGTAFNGRVDTLRMNVYYPTDDGAASRPLVLWVHGGGFTGGNRAEMNALCKRWAERGYVAATISYRLGFYGPFPFDPPFAYDTSEVLRAVYRGVQDFRSALKYLVTNASRYNIDTSRTVVGGVSAGAIISLHASFVDATDTRLPSLGNISPVVRGSEEFARLDIGSLQGQSYPGTPLPTIRAVVNIFGALTSINLLQGAPFVPTYSYHQRADPVVPCAIAKGLWGLPFNVSANYAQLVGSCAMTTEFEKRGIPTDQYETWIYEGADHALHGHALERNLLLFFEADAHCLGLGCDDPVDAFAFHHARLNGVDANVVRSDFHRQALGKSDHAPLGRRIRGAKWKGQTAGSRRQIDDRAAAGCLDQRHGESGAVIHAVEIHLDATFPFLDRKVFDFSGRAGDAGVIDQAVQSTQMLPHVCE